MPPGSTATVFVPAADAARVREGDRPVTAAPSIRFLRFADGRAVYEIGSGEFRFASPL
jgi:alpha-L-rhamnosidase